MLPVSQKVTKTWEVDTDIHSINNGVFIVPVGTTY